MKSYFGKLALDSYWSHSYSDKQLIGTSSYFSSASKQIGAVKLPAGATSVGQLSGHCGSMQTN